MSDRHWDLAWEDRPTEVANLYNPAFGGELLYRAVGSYFRTGGTAMPFVLAFLVLPLALHSSTRERLPKRADAAFGSWVADHREILIDVPHRARTLRPITRESIIFMTQLQVLAIDRGLIPGQSRITLPRSLVSTDEVSAARRACSFVGRWFAEQSSTSFVLQSFGLRP